MTGLNLSNEDSQTVQIEATRSNQALVTDANAVVDEINNGGNSADIPFSAITPVNLYYIARRLRNQAVARQVVTELLAALLVCPLDHTSLQMALSLPFTDYEDAVQHASAVIVHYRVID